MTDFAAYIRDAEVSASVSHETNEIIVLVETKRQTCLEGQRLLPAFAWLAKPTGIAMVNPATMVATFLNFVILSFCDVGMDLSYDWLGGNVQC